jgi:hypothetical protein
MKKLACALCLAGLLMTSPLVAQVRDETILTYDVIQSERKNIVMDALDITAEQMKALSPIYDAYLKEMLGLDARRVALIKEFLGTHKNLADVDAERMLYELITFDAMMLEIHKRYSEEFKTVLPARTVLRLWQIENKLDTVIDAEIAKDIPLAR